jgi:DNA-binding response OmpR family regulator
MAETVSPDTSLDRWLAGRGLRGNPFGRWNAEHDHDLPSYFVDLAGFDERRRLELLRLTVPCVVFARRGCGKTAQRQMLAAHCRPFEENSARLAVIYTYGGFERALRNAGDDVQQVRPMHHVDALLSIALKALLGEVERDGKVKTALMGSGVAPRLPAYVARFAPHLTGSLPASGSAGSLDDLDSVELLRGFSKLAQSAGLDLCVVLVDGLDEFLPTADDPANAVKFLSSLLGTLALIECPGWAFKFFLPQELESAVSACDWFRADRIRTFPPIAWSDGDLLALIRQRLIHFSVREPPYQDLAQLCGDTLAPVIDRELASLAVKLPRAALILADMLLQEHCHQAHLLERITLQAWERVKEQWQDRRTDFTPDAVHPDVRWIEAVEPISPSVSGQAGRPVLWIEKGSGLVWLGGREIRREINPKDYSVLICLYRHRSEVCTRETIAQEAWEEVTDTGWVSDEAINQSIARLRRVLERFAPDRKYVETIRSKNREQSGYRLHPRGLD